MFVRIKLSSFFSISSSTESDLHRHSFTQPLNHAWSLFEGFIWVLWMGPVNFAAGCVGKERALFLPLVEWHSGLTCWICVKPRRALSNMEFESWWMLLNSPAASFTLQVCRGGIACWVAVVTTTTEPGPLQMGSLVLESLIFPLFRQRGMLTHNSGWSRRKNSCW